jgi:hypothetical protein
MQPGLEETVCARHAGIKNRMYLANHATNKNVRNAAN